MFNIFGRKKRDDKPTPPWVLWLVGLFLVYSMFASRDQNSSVSKGLEQAQQHLETQQVFKLDNYTNPLKDTRSLRIKDKDIGKGSPAICGEEVTIAYEAMLTGNVPAKEQAPKDTPYSFRIGEKKASQMLEEGIIGMQVGGTRSLVAPISMSHLDPAQKEDLKPDSLVKLEVELLSITESLPDTFSSAYRIADVTQAAGKTIRCGDTVKAHVTLWDVAGKKLYSSRDDKRILEFTPGQSEVFVGLEQGVIGMTKGSTRMLVVPPEFQKTMRGNKPAIDLPVKKTETVLVDIEALP